MAKVFYQIENGKVIGYQYGTDVPGDTSGTKQVLDDWVLESPGTRSICECDTDSENPVIDKSKYLKVVAGKVVLKTQAEKNQVDADETSSENTKKSARKTILDGIKAKLALTDADMKELVGIY